MDLARDRVVDSGNWIPRRTVLLFLWNALGLFSAGLLVPSAAVQGVLFVSAALSGIGFLVLLATYWLLGRDGGAIQRRFHAALASALPWDGKGQALDIGTGNGVLPVLLAKRYPEARVTGIDPWGKPWAYSRAACQGNARSEGVAERVSFLQAEAGRLPFGDGEFDAVVSCFAFHTVGAGDRFELITEALRVLAPGGGFAFVDLFHRQFYSQPEELRARLEGLGFEGVRYVPMAEILSIPWLLRNPQVAGGSRLLCGRKPSA